MLWGDSKKKITEEEMREIRIALSNTLDKREMAEIEKLFHSDLHESGIEKGIDRAEYEQGMQWLRSNMSKHVLEESDLELIAKYFEEHLQD